MELSKKIVTVLIVLSFLFVLVMDCINITQFINYRVHIDNTITNVITFISILIGFISAIFVMIQQTQNSYVLELLRKLGLLEIFNQSFKTLMYIGFINVITLILMNFLADNLKFFKIITYFACPLTTYFLLSSYNIITTICKMISSEEILRKLDRKIEKDDIKF